MREYKHKEKIDLTKDYDLMTRREKRAYKRMLGRCNIMSLSDDDLIRLGDDRVFCGAEVIDRLIETKRLIIGGYSDEYCHIEGKVEINL